MAHKTLQKFLFVTMLGCIITPGSTHAKEPLNFKPLSENSVSFSSHVHLSSYTENILKTSTDLTAVSTIDLNTDGLDEFVLKRQNCITGRHCTFYILAETPDKIVELGRIDAKEITISDKIKNGSRVLVVYNDVSNDYTSKEYAWIPLEKRYLPISTIE